MSTYARSDAHKELMRDLRGIMQRLELNQTQLGVYLGVPQTTVNNWFTGERRPNTAVRRLIYVMGLLEALAPDIHANLVPRPKGPRDAEGDR